MSNREDLFDESKATALMDLYSRQIGTYGVETMKNLTKLRVLVIGLRGVGVETAKNLILAGPGAVTIFDNSPVTFADLGTNFFFNEEKISKRRSEAALEQLKELNPFVEVSSHSGELTDEFLLTFGAIIVTDHLPFDQLVHINELCHNRKSGETFSPIMFLLALTEGVSGTIFTDYGPKHTVTDQDGEPARINVIEDITVQKDSEGKSYLLITVNALKHGLDDDSEIKITDVEGMTEINQLDKIKIKRVYKTMKDDKGKPREILVLNKIRIDVEGCEKWGQYKGQGMISEIKPAKELEFLPLSEAVKKPTTSSDMMGFVRHPNEEKMYAGRGAQIHFGRLAIWEFQKRKNHLPRLHNEEDANATFEIAREIAEEYKKIEGAITVNEIDAKVVKSMALYSEIELCGLTAFLGGVIAQEVIKKFGKYTPIHQWIHIDYLELLPEKIPEDAKPIGSRHDNQIAVFGKAFQDKLGKQRWFMVGCGALGCEYLKGFSLMGLGASGGTLYVTDMDTIEVSNLSRQFLFRRDNVGMLKSQTAAAAARKMNPAMNITVFDVPVGPDTENKFDDAYWSNLDGVCNALDNIKAREYTDSKCVFFEKPLLESGTLGTKANSEMVLPHKTKSYAEHEATGDEESIPMCTLRNFPHLIEHCIEWSRAQFTDLFESPAASFNKYFKNPSEFLADVKKQKEAEALDVAQNVTKLSTFFVKGPSYESCMHFAFSLFIAQFRDRILNLITAFPENAEKTDENGVKIPFWSGSKRFPRALHFDPDDEHHFEFMFNCSNMYAYLFNMPPIRDRKIFKKRLLDAKLTPPEFVPDSVFMKQVQNEVKDAEDKANQNQPTEEKKVEFNDAETLQQLLESLEKLDREKFYPLHKAEFEKDDDTNFHIDFITSCANLRALNYHITPATRHKCKMIAGRIIPAVATTTAMITGVVEMEFFKLLLGLGVDKFCNSNINLAVSDFKLFEPIGPKQRKEAYDPLEGEIVVPIPAGFTIWDKVLVDHGDLTVEQFVDLFPKLHHGCTTDSLFFLNDKNSFWLSCPVTSSQKAMVATNYPLKISEIYASRFGPSDKKSIRLDASVRSAEGKPAVVPPIIFKYRK